jgi:hypothetical protein
MYMYLYILTKSVQASCILYVVDSPRNGTAAYLHLDLRRADTVSLVTVNAMQCNAFYNILSFYAVAKASVQEALKTDSSAYLYYCYCCTVMILQ